MLRWLSAEATVEATAVDADRLDFIAVLVKASAGCSISGTAIGAINPQGKFAVAITADYVSIKGEAEVGAAQPDGRLSRVGRDITARNLYHVAVRAVVQAPSGGVDLDARIIGNRRVPGTTSASVAIPATTHLELSAATPVDPDAATVVAPGIALDAAGTADLADHGDAAPGIGVAVVATAIIGFAADGLLGTGKRSECGHHDQESECAEQNSWVQVVDSLSAYRSVVPAQTFYRPETEE